MSNLYSKISFSDIAARYNTINAIPPEANTQLGETIKALTNTQLSLDMGCGAGRIGIPGAQGGTPIVGVEIDASMIGEAVKNSTDLPFTGIHGDILHTPFADNTFAAVFCINVLHLVPEWEQVIQEAIRVMKPGGLYIDGRDWLDPESCAGSLRSQLRRVVMGLAPGLRPTAAASPKVMADALTASGGETQDAIIATSWTLHMSPADVVQQMADRQHNETWMLDDDLLSQAVEQLEIWAKETWDDINQVEEVEKRVLLTVTRGLK